METDHAAAPQRVTVEAYGVAVGLRSSPSTVRDVIGRLPAVYSTTDRSPTVTWQIDTSPVGSELTIHRDGRLVASMSTEHEAAERLAGEIELYVAEHAHARIFIHAASVVFHDHIVVLPGPSMAGKSTLAVALLRAGATYLSDEYTVLDLSGTVFAYPRPPKLRHGSAETVRRGVSWADPVGTIKLVADLKWDSTHNWAVREGSASEAVLSLLSNCVAARSRPAEALEAVTNASLSTRFLRGTRGEADEAVDLLAAFLATSSPERSIRLP